MAVGLPLKTTYADGDVYSASDVNDTNGTINLTAAPYAAGKNKIINGDFGVWQRGTSFTNNTAADVYTADRWVSQVNGTGTRTISQQTFTPGTAPVAGYEGTFFLRMGCSSSGTASYFNIKQKIENVRTFAGQTVTVSFWAKASASLTTGFFGFTQQFGTGGSGSVDTSASNLTFTTSWVRYTTTFSVPSVSGKTIGANSCLEFAISFGSGTFTSFDLWGFQIEAGSTATAFQTATGTISGELAACQRYYVRWSDSTALYPLVSPSGFTVNSTTATGFLNLPVRMRTVPSSMEFSTLVIQDINLNNFTVTSVSLDNATFGGNTLQVNFFSTGITSGRFARVFGNASTSSYMALSAEL